MPPFMMLTLPLAVPPTMELPTLVQPTGVHLETHRVRPGDTLYDLAARYDTTPSAIAAVNHLSGVGLIRVDEVLRIPAGQSVVKRSAATTARHTVQAGDTLSDVAARYGTTVAALTKANGIASNRFIHPGQQLAIPGRTERVDRSFTQSSTASRSQPTRSSGHATPTRTETKARIVATARAHGVDPSLALAIGWQESGWNQNVTSSAGAIGTMQVMPESGTWAGGLVGRHLDLRDSHDNITAGVVILKQLTKMASNRDQVIAAYYQGLGSVRERGLYADTRQYVANVNYFRGRM